MTSRAQPQSREHRAGGGKRRGGGYQGGRAEVGPGTHGEGRGKGARPERGCGAWPEAQSGAAGVWARPGAGLTRRAGKCRPGFLLRGPGGGEGRGLEAGRKGGKVVRIPPLPSPAELILASCGDAQCPPADLPAPPRASRPRPGLRAPLLPWSGRRSSGGESREETEDEAAAPGSRRARGLPQQGKGLANGLDAWDPGGKYLGAEQETTQPPPSHHHHDPTPQEPSPCVWRQEPIWPICNARPRGGCFRRQVERGVCALLGKG